MTEASDHDGGHGVVAVRDDGETPEATVMTQSRARPCFHELLRTYCALYQEMWWSEVTEPRRRTTAVKDRRGPHGARRLAGLL